METVIVYIDVYFCYNFIINLILLMLTAFSSDRRLCFWKGALSGGLGSLFSCGMLLFDVNSFVLAVLLIGVSALMIRIAFSVRRFREFMKLLILYYLLNFMLAGGIRFSGNMGGQNMLGMLAVIAGIFLLVVFGWIYSFFLKKKAVFRVQEIVVIYDGKPLILRAFADTGNQLTDPISHAKVIVIKEDILLQFLGVSSREQVPGFRLIPCKSVNLGEGYLWGFKPQAVFCDGKPLYAILAASQSLTGQEYDAIYNPAILLS